MSVVKVTSSGQITIPKVIRVELGVDYFSCELTDEGILFRPIGDTGVIRKKKRPKYTMDDLLKFSFKGKNPNETLADKIDEIVYGDL